MKQDGDSGRDFLKELLGVLISDLTLVFLLGIFLTSDQSLSSVSSIVSTQW